MGCFSLFLLFLLLLVCVSVDGQALAPALYVFGDSLVDVGNNNFIILSILKANFPHNGVDFANRRATGRFSNGKNTADFTAEKLGLPTPPPYLSVSFGNGNDFLRGVNFASGGAGILQRTNEGQCISLDQQIGYYADVVQPAIVRELGATQANVHFSKSIFLVVVGGNDIIVQSSIGLSPAYLNSLSAKFNEQLRRIYASGGRKFVVSGMPPVGCTPSFRLRKNRNGEQCDEEVNDFSKKLSDAIRSTLEGVSSEFGDMSYSFLDAHVAVLEFITKPSDHGFVVVKSACCGLGDLRAVVACLPIARFCSNRNQFLFWDLVHPTEATARKLTDIVFTGSSPFVFPINLRQLAAL